MSADRPRLLELRVEADPQAWRAAGFAVGEDGRCRVGSTDVVLGGAGGGGLAGWTLEGVVPGEDGLDGLPTRTGHAARDAVTAEHPNAVTGIDHVVVTTPDVARTFETLDAAGLELRRVRDGGSPERPLRQGFFLLSDALIEVVGPPERAGDEPSAFWGITFVSADLDATVARLGPDAAPPREAVQAGRRIAVAPREAGLGVRVAFMSPRG